MWLFIPVVLYGLACFAFSLKMEGASSTMLAAIGGLCVAVGIIAVTLENNRASDEDD